MVSKFNGRYNVSTIIGAITVKFSFAWLVTYFVSVTLNKVGRISHYGYRVIYITLFAVFIFTIGASIDKLHAQTTPTVTTNWTGNTLNVPLNFGRNFDLKFELSATSSQDVSVNYVEDRTTATHVGNSYRIDSDPSSTFTDDSSPMTITAGDTAGIIRIRKFTGFNSDSIIAGKTITLNFTLTNANFSDNTTTQTLTITFVDKPAVSIVAGISEVADSDFSDWTVFISPAQSEDITVNITLGGTATRTGNSITAVTIPANKTFVAHKQTFSSAGTYTVTLNSTHSDASKYVFVPGRDVINVDVVDGTNLTEVSLGAAPSITRNDTSFTITVSDTRTRTSRLNVRYRLVDFGTNKGFVGEFTTWTSLQVGQSVDITVTIIRADGVGVDGDGVIRVELMPGPNYKISDSAGVRDVNIPSHAQTGTPEVLLKEVPSSVTQGHDFSFTIEAEGTIEATGLPVTLQFGEGSATIITGITPGTYVDGGNSTITIPQSGSQVILVSTTKPSGNADQNLTITLAGAGSTYTISNSAGAASATVLSKENSNPSSSRPRLTLEQFSSKSVSGSAEDSMKFKVLASHAPNSALTVNIRATATGPNFLNGSYLMETVQLTTSETEFEVQITIPPGGLNQTGMITAELLDGADYTLADDPHHKTTANLTTARPTISVTGLTGSVTQGHPFSFLVEASTTLFSTISVRIQLNDGSLGSITSSTPTSVFVANAEGTVTIPISGSIEVTVATQNPATGATGDVNGNITIFNPQGAQVNSYKVDGGSASRVYPVVFKDNTVTTASKPKISIAAASTALVRADQNANANFTITATPQPTGMVNVSYLVSETGNFVSVESDTITLLTSSTTTTLEVPTTDSNTGTDDADSTITVRLLDGSDYTLIDPPGHIATRIATDDVISELSITDTSLMEGTDNAMGVMEFTVTASPAATTQFTVEWATSIEAGVDTATEDTDFIAASGMLTFMVTDTMQKFRVVIKGDSTPEPDETFTVTLSSVSPGAQLSANFSARGTITNDDGHGLQIADASLVEGDADETTNMNFTVELVPPSSNAITFDWMTSIESNDTATEGTDYRASSGDDITIAANTSSVNLMVPIIGDATPELDETFTLTLSGVTSGVKLLSAKARGNIINDDGEEITLASESLLEGDTGMSQMQFTISVETAVTTGFTVNWATSIESDDTATEGTDYTKGSGTATFMSTDTMQTFTVDIIGDATPEFNETFTVTLSNPSVGAYVSNSKGSAKGTITNDDGSGLSIEAASVIEGSAGSTTFMKFTVSVIPPSSSEITYMWATSNDSANTAAEAGTDYSTSGSTETIAMNEPTSTFNVPILDDEKFESEETFIVTLSNPTGAILLLASAKGTIRDNDGLPVVTIAADSGHANESVGRVEFMLFATGLGGETTLMINATPSQGNLAFLASGIANRPADFPVVFSNSNDDGTYTGVLQIPIVDDAPRTDSGEISLKLNTDATPATYELGDIVSGTILVVDDDYNVRVPRVSIAPVTRSPIQEGDPIEIEITTGDPAPSTGSSIDVAINVVQEGGDYIAFRVPRSKRLSSNSDSIKIYTHNDTVPDGPGKIIVTISESGNRYTVDPVKAEVEVKITDTDTANTPQEARVSVAEAAIDAILALDQFAVNSPNTESAPVILPLISVSAVATSVVEGTPVQFSISGNENFRDDVVVEYTLTPEGDFFDNLSDDVQSINLTEAQKIAQVEIATINDTYAEQDGALTLTLLDRDTYDLADQSNARVIVSDLADRQQRVEDISLASQDIFPDMTGATAARTLGFTTERISEAFASSGVSSTFNYNGNESLTSLLTAGGEALNSDSMTLREVLGSSSFAISLFPETDRPSMATIWGLGDYRGMASGEGLNSRSWDADVFTGHLGLDAMLGQGMLVGISATVTEFDIDHTGATDGELTFTSRTTALNPYLGWTSSDQDAELRAVAGYGVGEIDIEQANYELQTVSNTYHTLGITGNQRIYASESILEGGSSELSITSQTWYARQNLFGIDGFINSMQTDASHYRIGIEGSHTQKLASGSSVKPTFSIGIRGDGKNDQSIFGMEVGGGLNYTSTFGLSLAGNSSMFLIEQGEIQKWSLIGTFNYDRGNDKLGTIMEVSPFYGQMQGGNSRSLWSSDILESVSETGQYMDGTHVDTELGYGLSILDDTSRLTPFGGIGYSDDADNKYHVGTRLQLGSDLEFELTGTQETDTTGTLNQKIKLDGAFNW